MAVETGGVQELVDFAPEDFLVTSFYLDVDAREFPSPQHVEKALDSLLHAANIEREQVEKDLSHEASESLRADLHKIERFVKKEFRRTDTNGLAIFSCSAQDFWEVVQLPNPVESRVVFGSRPRVAPIAAFLSHTKPTAILLTDRKRARIITMKGSDVKEWTNLEDRMIQRSKAGGWSQMRYQRHADEWAKHHVDHAAELVLRLEQHYPFDWLILGTEVEIESDLKEGLHPYVKDRIIGHIHVRLDASLSEVVERATALREEAEAQLIDNLIQQIQEYAGAGGRGTIGLSATIKALNEQKVHILLVQEGFEEPGAECPDCGLLIAERRDTCPACNEPMKPVENIVESAIQKAFELGSRVEVATEYGKLEPIQCIGSIMYY
jgi:peptide chain release factor subunit 1